MFFLYLSLSYILFLILTITLSLFLTIILSLSSFSLSQSFLSRNHFVCTIAFLLHASTFSLFLSHLVTAMLLFTSHSQWPTHFLHTHTHTQTNCLSDVSSPFFFYSQAYSLSLSQAHTWKHTHTHFLTHGHSHTFFHFTPVLSFSWTRIFFL